jgi:hypothetical protein
VIEATEAVYVQERKLRREVERKARIITVPNRTPVLIARAEHVLTIVRV